MFKLKDRIILEKDVNAIPSGCYKLLDFDDYFYTFGVGSKILFTITQDATPLLRKVYPPIALTHPNEFIPRYYELLKQMKNAPIDLTKPFTFCLLDASIPAVQKFESSYPFETRQ